jgi:hypothetical protein
MSKLLKRFIALFIIVLIVMACSKNDKSKNEKLIPSSELVSLLTDLYIADGLLAFPPVRSHFFERDSILNYIDILEKRGISKERMDRTMRYYFTKNPRKLEKIYDQVLARLSEMQAELESELPPENMRAKNLWNLNERYLLPEEGIQNTGKFNIEISDTGWYEFSFSALIYPDDQGLNPRTTIYFWHEDGTEEGVTDYWNDVPLIRDGTRHSYSVSKRLTDTSYTHIKGMLYNHDPRPARWEKHARFSDMILRQTDLQ